MAVVGGDREIAAFVEPVGSEARPVAIDPAAIDLAAGEPDRVAAAVIGAAVAILFDGAAEFRDHDEDRIVPIAAEPFGQGGEAAAERAQPVGELAGLGALPDMRVPAAEREE